MKRYLMQHGHWTTEIEPADNGKYRYRIVTSSGLSPLTGPSALAETWEGAKETAARHMEWARMISMDRKRDA